jgi:hypothetical protein
MDVSGTTIAKTKISLVLVDVVVQTCDEVRDCLDRDGARSDILKPTP